MWNDNDKIMDIFNRVNEGELRFPCTCPVCGKHSGHIYIQRHNDKHCGIWTWCSLCNSYSHMSGEAPVWWRNPDFIDDNQLCSEPEYLDKISGKIDTWVNSVVPIDNVALADSFTMEDRFEVKVTEKLQEILVGTVGILVVRNDFKTMSMDFICADGETINLDITPEKTERIFEVVD